MFALTTVICGGLLAAAVLVPAPADVLPFVIAVCVAVPIAAGYQLASAVAALRDPHRQLRRELDRLPETRHPLGH